MMAVDSPKVSIVTPVFNSEKYLTQMIDSVLSQSYGNWELILVDDCSTDSSVSIIKEFQKRDDRVQLLFMHSNSGSGIARNFAIEAASGEFIAFLDSDDIWHVDKLRLQIAFMQERSLVFSHTSYGYIDSNGNRIKKTFHVSKKPVNYYDLLKRTEISCLTAVYKASEIGKYFMTAHRRKQDYALWLRILKDSYVCYGLDVELAYYRLHSKSATSNKFALLPKHISFLMETQQMNFFQATFYTIVWAFNGFLRYYIRK